MKLLLKLFVALVLLLVVVVGGYALYIQLTWDRDYGRFEKPAIKASQDPEVIRRGEYIAHSVAHCSVCHVPQEVTEKRVAGEHPAMTGEHVWKMGPFGTLYSRNITPDKETGIGDWTDEELARAIRFGVGRDGKALPFMAMAVGAMADEDLQAVVSYLRSTAPVRHVNKPHEPGLVLKWLATQLNPDFRKGLIASFNLKYAPPAAEPSTARGAYLARGPGACIGCHSPFGLSGKMDGPEFSGSSQGEPDPEDEKMVFRTPNLTPHPETGHITTWSEDAFVVRFKAGRSIKGSKMPWEAFREMSESDLRSVFRYLKSLPPARNYIGPTHRQATEDPSRDSVAAR